MAKNIVKVKKSKLRKRARKHSVSAAGIVAGTATRCAINVPVVRDLAGYGAKEYVEKRVDRKWVTHFNPAADRTVRAVRVLGEEGGKAVQSHNARSFCSATFGGGIVAGGKALRNTTSRLINGETERTSARPLAKQAPNLVRQWSAWRRTSL